MQSNVYIASCASWLPEAMMPIEKAIKSGEYASKDAKAMGYESIAVSPPNVSVEMMALDAATNAIEQANVSGSELAMLTYNAVHRHGHPQLWCPASYLQHELGAEDAMPLSIYQGCNGQLLSMEMLASILLKSAKNYALAVTADKFSFGGINRWHGDYGIVYGDAASAIVLSSKPGIAKICTIKTVHKPFLEKLHRFDKPIDLNAKDAVDKQYNIRSTKKEFLQSYGKDAVINATKDAIQRLWQETFLEGVISPDQIHYFIFPNLSEEVLDTNYFSIYPQAKERSLWYLGKQLGHLGASDCAVGLDYLLNQNNLMPGEKIACIGAGAGFSWTLMIIEKL